MADISDVEQCIVNAVYATIYPSGVNHASIIGSTCRVYRGWPIPANLNADLSAGIVNVTVSPDEAPGRTTTRYLPSWQTRVSSPGTTLTAIDGVVSVGGAPQIGDVVGILVNGTPYIYRILLSDTIDLIAEGLAASMTGSISASVSGSAITFNEPVVVTCRVVCDGTSQLEARRQEKGIRVIFWCPDPISRDSLSSAIDQLMVQTPFLPLDDTTSARVTYRDTSAYDQSENANLYRRDLLYDVEYATIVTQESPSMLFGDINLASEQLYG
jgi:hypothetical protein